MPFGRAFLDEFPLDPSITYLNHGTVGVTPRRVLAVQQAIRDEIERQPSRFLLRELTAPATSVGLPRAEKPRLRVAAHAVAAFLGAAGDDLVFVDNITTGANAVLRSFPFAPGDEILVTDLGYGGVTKAAQFAAREKGATVRTVTMPWPPTPDTFADAIVEAVGPAHAPRRRRSHHRRERARAAARRHRRRLRAKGVAVMADGAHAPGAISFRIAGARRRLVRRQPAQVDVGAAQQRHPLGRARSGRRRCIPRSSRGASTRISRRPSTCQARATHRRISRHRRPSICSTSGASRPSGATCMTSRGRPRSTSRNAGTRRSTRRRR